MKTVTFPGEPETKDVGAVTRLWPAGVLRVMCDGTCDLSLTYFRAPTVATLKFTDTTRATVEFAGDLDDLLKADLVKIAKSMGIDDGGLKADIVARIRPT